jgi:hypothetical protein
MDLAERRVLLASLFARRSRRIYERPFDILRIF